MVWPFDRAAAAAFIRSASVDRIGVVAVHRQHPSSLVVAVVIVVVVVAIVAVVESVSDGARVVLRIITTIPNAGGLVIYRYVLMRIGRVCNFSPIFGI